VTKGEELLDESNPKMVLADKAYDTDYSLIEMHNVGA
jgi:hypothetical protein